MDHFQHREEHVEQDMVLIQVNLDDMNPELCPYILDLLFEAGANDAFWIPIVMKKGRPGLMLNVLAGEKDLPVMEDIIFRETTTLGVRYLRADCHRLAREFRKVHTLWGDITVKVGYHQGRVVQFAPEFQECADVAKSHQVALKVVYDEVRKNFAAQYKTHHGDK